MALERNKGQVLAPHPVLLHGTSRSGTGQGFEGKCLSCACKCWNFVSDG